MKSFLLQPYPVNRSIGRKLVIGAGIGLFVALFTAVFKPFGIALLPPHQQWLHPILFGLVTFAVCSLCEIVLPRLLPGIFAEEQWESWKEIVFLLFIVVCISAGNYWLMHVLYPEPPGGRRFSKVLSITAEVGIFPVVFVVLMKQMLLYRRYVDEAKRLNQQLEPASLQPLTQPPVTPERRIVLEGEGLKERLELLPEQILFVRSADNYVEVFFSTESGIGSQLLRSSLKNVAQQLSSFPAFCRCHRMHLVNLDLVERISGNAQGLRLHLRGVQDPIPVSRSLTPETKERLSHLSHSPHAL
jgi:hypothetical protein